MAYAHVVSVGKDRAKLGSWQESVISHNPEKRYHLLISSRNFRPLKLGDVVHYNSGMLFPSDRIDRHYLGNEWRKAGIEEKLLYDSDNARKIVIPAAFYDGSNGHALFVGYWRNIGDAVLKGRHDYLDGKFGNMLIAVFNHEYGVEMEVYRKAGEQNIHMDTDWTVDGKNILAELKEEGSQNAKEALAEKIQKHVKEFRITDMQLREFRLA